MGIKANSVMDVANYIVDYCIDESMPVSNLKLQKLLYYVQAASLAECDKRMFRDEISAWKYGPVIETVYHNFKWYVDREITECSSERIPGAGLADGKDYDPADKLDAGAKELIERVVDSYRDYSALGMVRKTHEEEPWKMAVEGGEDFIDTDEIRGFYKNNRELIYGKQ